MSRPRVFAVQEDTKKNLLPALDFGDLEHILDALDQVGLNPDPWVRKISRALSDFTVDDFILAVGDPVAIGVACAVASERTGGCFKVLKWDRQERRYFPVKIDTCRKGASQKSSPASKS